jgi:integrase
VLRWTGLRVSDAINLKWEHIHFDRGTNGEIEILTKKRNKIAIIPLAHTIFCKGHTPKGNRIREISS